MQQTISNIYQLHRGKPYQAPRQRQSPPRWLAICLMIGIILVFSCACSPAPTTWCDVLHGPAPVSDAECQAVHGLLLPSTLPPARGNSWADDPNVALLGFHIFYDARFSQNGDIRCATCHQPERHFADGKPLAVGLGTAARNAPTLLNAAWNHWQFWDGRADSLWSQPLFALENPVEMGTSRLALAHTVAEAYGAAYTASFGPLPDFQDSRRFPAAGMPGTTAFDSMAAADKTAINRVAANVGKALEAYVRRVAAGPSAFDAYLQGNRDAIDAEAVQGLGVFVRVGCIQCHNGGNFTDDDFHNLGVPDTPDQPTDPGRGGGLAILATNPFNSAGPYYDGTAGRSDDSAAAAPAALGAFKTPSLRNLDSSAPYGHSGVFATLEEVVDFHLQGGQVPSLGQRDPLLTPVQLTAADRAALLAFLRTLQGTYRGAYGAPPYWWNWPDR